MVPAKLKSRNESTFGNPGRLIALLKDEVPSAAKNKGKIIEGTTNAGWRRSASTERFDIATVWRNPRRQL
jgi:hypothetical protein